MNIIECENKVLLLERRISRERTARKSAESVLEDKSLEAYNLNQSLIQANSEMKKLLVAVEQSPASVIIADIKGYIQYTNPMFSKLTGWSFEEIEGKHTRILGSGLTPQSTYQDLWETILEGNIWKGEIYNKKKNNQQYLQSVTISPIFDEHGKIIHFLSNSEDITQRKEYQERIHHLAHHDVLTGLLNRFSLEDRLEQSIAYSMRRKLQLAVLFLDLDRFKSINDTLGHKAGDELLIQVANRLKGIFRRKNDTVARIGGDEFVVVLSEIDNPVYAALTAKAIVEILSLPYVYEKEELLTSPSIGIAVFPSDSEDAAKLLKSADTAMYHVKKTGRASYEFFSEQMNLVVEENLRLVKDLRQAMSDDLLELYYQPKICVSNHSVCGVEALLRWNHAELGFISPEKFIPIAEENDLIADLGFWVINTAFKQLADWRLSGLNEISIAINVSPKQLESENFISEVKKSILKFDINTDHIEFEITETATMDNTDRSIVKLNELKQLGIKLAIDDFGTGYSSLAYLKMLPIQVLKLDKSFVMNLENDENNAAICKATISLGHDLGYKIVAEGVETQAQSDFLNENNCDMLQGYFYSRPNTAKEIKKFISTF